MTNDRDSDNHAEKPPPPPPPPKRIVREDAPTPIRKDDRKEREDR